MLAWLPKEESFPLIPGFFHLTLVRNPGVAFGFFRDHESLLLALISASLLILAFFGFRVFKEDSSQETSKKTPAMTRWALALILGGAIGNWIDRLRFKAVIDFLDFRVWPVFNVADSAITIGVGLYLLLFLKEAGKKS